MGAVKNARADLQILGLNQEHVFDGVRFGARLTMKGQRAKYDVLLVKFAVCRRFAHQGCDVSMPLVSKP
ncbi:hypothetical protein D3C76_1556060 [compost metagenome]